MSLFFKKKTFTVGILTLDALVSETHTRSATITENPVEDGSIISDHIINDPQKLAIEGFVTNSPVSLFAALSFLSFEDKVISAFDKLEEIYNDRATVSVVTNLKVYEDMVIENLEIEKNNSTGDSLPFTMDLVEIIKVSNSTIAIPNQRLGRRRRQTQGLKKSGRLAFVGPPSPF